MTAEVPAGVASPEDVAELRRLLAVAQQTAKTSTNRANSEAGQVSRWKARRDDLAASVREALGMGPAPEHIHVKPIIDRIGELCSDRDEAVALTDGLRTRLQVARDALETERERSAALAKAVRAAQAKVNANARRVRTLDTSRADVVKAAAEAEAERDAARRAELLTEASDELRAALEAELRADLAAELAAVEGRTARALAAAEERVTAAAGMAADAQARATKAIRAADDRAERARKLQRDGVAAAEAAATATAERKARAAEAKLRRELDSTRAEVAKLEAGRAMLEREVAGARTEVEQHRRRPIPAAPREPLLAVLATGARSVTAHRARLAGWAAGEGADVEAARALAVVVRDDAAPPEARMRAQTALAGLLGGVR
jgi:hypothetical protein